MMKLVETASEFLDDVGKEHIGSLRSSSQRNKVSLWHHSGRRRLRAHAQACDSWRMESHYATDIKAKGFGEVSFSELTFLQALVDYIHIRSPCYLEQKNIDAEGKSVDVETTTNNTLTKAIDQFVQMVIAVEQ